MQLKMACNFQKLLTNTYNLVGFKKQQSYDTIYSWFHLDSERERDRDRDELSRFTSSSAFERDR